MPGRLAASIITGLDLQAPWAQSSLFSRERRFASVQVSIPLLPCPGHDHIHNIYGIMTDIYIVSILVTITALLRGPLIQRSSSVQVINVSQNGTIDLPITVNISNFWAGKMSTLDDSDDGQFSPGFSDVIRDFLDKAPLRIPGARCENCTLTIKVRCTFWMIFFFNGLSVLSSSFPCP